MKSEPIDCARVLEYLLERDDEVPASAELATACSAHLDRCAACREQAERLGTALAALRERATDPVPSIDLWAGVRATLAAEERLAIPAAPVAPLRTGTVRRSPSLVRRASAFAAVAAALALVWFLGDAATPPQPKESSSPSAPVVARTDAALAPPQPALVANPAGGSPAAVRTLPLVGAPELLPAPPSGGLRRATGEERRRDFSVPFESATETSGWSLASDRELR